MPDTRQTFHHQLDDVQRDLAAGRRRASPSRSPAAPRPSSPSTSPRPQAHHRRRRRDRRAHPRHRGALLHAPRPPAADGQRPAGDRHRHPADVGDRALGRPHGQRGQGHPPPLRHRGPARAPRPAAGDGRRGRPALPARHGRLRRRRRQPGRRPRRHGRPARPAAQGLHPGDLRALRRRRATCRRPCSSRSSAATTSASATTP